MDYRILGPLEVMDRDRPLVLGGEKQRALLAVLLLHAGEAVSADRLIDDLWGASPPSSALRLAVRQRLAPGFDERLEAVEVKLPWLDLQQVSAPTGHEHTARRSRRSLPVGFGQPR